MVKLLVLCLLLTTLALCDQKNYTDFVADLKSKMQDTTGPYHHAAFERLAYIVDTYGPRMWGSQTLEMVINQMAKYATEQNFDNIKLEPVTGWDKWIRGHEELILYDPRPFPQKLGLIGLGGSISGHVVAEAIVVNTFEQLEQLGTEKVKGKIVVYNQGWTNYYEKVIFRAQGADQAAKYGAVAALVRSIASKSIYSPHAGRQYSTKIPIAAITIEDAEMMQRMQDRGQKIKLQFTLENKVIKNAASNNLVFDIKGSQKPDEILLMGGHIDSWDTGSQTGANDDGGGFITCYEAMRLLQKSGYKPKRTLRFIAWSGEEWGDPNNGNKAYFRQHKDELKNHIVAFEDDLGSTKLYGFGYQLLHGSPKGKQVVQSVLNNYLPALNASTFSDDGEAVDTTPLYEVGIPTMKNLIEDNASHDFYFSYHHSAGDSMTMMNADDLDSNVVGLAAMFYILADLEDSIPLPEIKFDVSQQ